MTRRLLGSSRPILAVILAAVLVVAAPLGASALWQMTSNAPAFTATTGARLAAPTVSCQNATANGQSAARLSWSNVAGATKYRISIHNNRNAGTGELATIDADPSGTTSYVAQGNLLSNLVWLLGVLLTGGTVFLRVTPLNNNWPTTESAPQNVQLDTSLGALTGAVRCL